MTRAQIAALGHPEGEILDKAVAVVKGKKATAKKYGVDIDDRVFTIILKRIKTSPSAYIHSYHPKAVQELAWAWLGTRQEMAT